MKIQELKSLVKAIIKEVMNDEGGTIHDIIVTTGGFFGYNERAYVEQLMMHNLKSKYGFEYQILGLKTATGGYDPKAKHEWKIRLELLPNVNMQVVKQAIENDPHVESVEFADVGESLDPKGSTEPSIGGSYAAQQTSVDGSNVRPERDPLTDPLLTGKPFKKDI